MGIENIKITLANGQKYKLRKPDTLCEIDRSRIVLFLLDNLKCYEGCSDGEIDEDGDFAIFKHNINYGLALPNSRLVGWAYKRKGKKT